MSELHVILLNGEVLPSRQIVKSRTVATLEPHAVLLDEVYGTLEHYFISFSLTVSTDLVGCTSTIIIQRIVLYIRTYVVLVLDVQCTYPL